MIRVTRLNGERFALNPDLIERVEAHPTRSSPWSTAPIRRRRVRRRGASSAIREYRAARSSPTPTRWTGGEYRRRRAEPPATGAERAPSVVPFREPRGALTHGSGHPDRHRRWRSVAIFASMILEGGSPMAIFLLPPLLLVFGGTFGAAMAGGLLKRRQRRSAAGSSWRCCRPRRRRPPTRIVDAVVRLAEKARREGLLALEDAGQGHRRPVPQARACSWPSTAPTPRSCATILEAEIDAKKAERQGRPRSSSPPWAATRRPSASSAPSSAWSTCWRT